MEIQKKIQQVHFSEEKIGRMNKNNKLRISWGFVLQLSDDAQHTEHNITLIWSKSTGKQQIDMDGTEIWFGRNQGRSILDHNWKTRDGRLRLHLLATCAPKVNENFRNYDLLINGQLFVSLPHYGKGIIAPIPPPMGQDNLNSIIQILYPNGYVPPVDKDEQQQQREENYHHHHSTAVVTTQRDEVTAAQTEYASNGNTNTNTDSFSSKGTQGMNLLDDYLPSMIIPLEQQQHQHQPNVQSATSDDDISNQPLIDLLG